MTRIILVRHGETTWNVEGRYQGQEDTPLSERGLEQGRLLAEGLKNIPLDRAISSPLQRSFKTCQFCADLHDLARIHYCYPVRNTGNYSQIMGYQYGGCSKLHLDFAQKIQNLRLDSHIQCRGRLISE